MSHGSVRHPSRAEQVLRSAGAVGCDEACSDVEELDAACDRGDNHILIGSDAVTRNEGDRFSDRFAVSRCVRL